MTVEGASQDTNELPGATEYTSDIDLKVEVDAGVQVFLFNLQYCFSALCSYKFISKIYPLISPKPTHPTFYWKYGSSIFSCLLSASLMST